MKITQHATVIQKVQPPNEQVQTVKHNVACLASCSIYWNIK